MKTLDGETVAISELEAFKTQTMTKANVAGLSCAIIQDDDMRFVFVKDAAGKISGLNIELQGLVLSAQKVD